MKEKDKFDSMIMQMIDEGLSYLTIVKSVCLGIKKTDDPEAEYSLYPSEICVRAKCPYATGGQNLSVPETGIQNYQCGLKKQIWIDEDGLEKKVIFKIEEHPPAAPICKKRKKFIAARKSELAA